MRQRNTRLTVFPFILIALTNAHLCHSQYLGIDENHPFSMSNAIRGGDYVTGLIDDPITVASLNPAAYEIESARLTIGGGTPTNHRSTDPFLWSPLNFSHLNIQTKKGSWNILAHIEEKSSSYRRIDDSQYTFERNRSIILSANRRLNDRVKAGCSVRWDDYLNSYNLVNGVEDCFFGYPTFFSEGYRSLNLISGISVRLSDRIVIHPSVEWRFVKTKHISRKWASSTEILLSPPDTLFDLFPLSWYNTAEFPRTSIQYPNLFLQASWQPTPAMTLKTALQYNAYQYHLLKKYASTSYYYFDQLQERTHGYSNSSIGFMSDFRISGGMKGSIALVHRRAVRDAREIDGPYTIDYSDDRSSPIKYYKLAAHKGKIVDQLGSLTIGSDVRVTEKLGVTVSETAYCLWHSNKLSRYEDDYRYSENKTSRRLSELRSGIQYALSDRWEVLVYLSLDRTTWVNDVFMSVSCSL
jgi:hypothetical protein